MHRELGPRVREDRYVDRELGRRELEAVPRDRPSELSPPVGGPVRDMAADLTAAVAVTLEEPEGQVDVTKIGREGRNADSVVGQAAAREAVAGQYLLESANDRAAELVSPAHVLARPVGQSDGLGSALHKRGIVAPAATRIAGDRRACEGSTRKSQPARLSTRSETWPHLTRLA